MKDLLFGDSFNDCFLLYAFENDKRLLHSRKSSLVDGVVEKETFANSLINCPNEKLCLAQCTTIQPCFAEIAENGNVNAQTYQNEFSIHYQATLQGIISAASTLKHALATHTSSSHIVNELAALQEQALQLRLDSLSFYCQSKCNVSQPSPPHHRKSLSHPHHNPQSSFDFSEYEILQQLSHSTMFGTIYLAQRKARWESAVAIKCSEKKRMRQRTIEERIAESPENEIDVLRWVSMLPPASSSSIFSPYPPREFYPGQQHICRLLQTGEDSSNFYCVLEHFHCDLQEYLAAKPRLSELEARTFFFQIAQALYYLHRIAKVAHLDLSLENILLDAPQLNAFLCDFGAAIRLSSSSSSLEPLEAKHPGFSSSFRPGKLSYMSGELFSGRSFLASSADIYSLGVVLLRILCGPKAFAVTQPNSTLWKMAVEEGRMDSAMEVVELDWEGLSDNAKELFGRMLCPEVRRANVEEVLMSDWLRVERENAWKKGNAVLLHMNERDPKKYPRPN